MRRTQEERSAATRVRLLDATIECLVEHGYAGTTVQRVAERAEVTRGAQVHHFPTKQLLVLAAVRHLNELQAREVATRLAGLGASVDALLDVLWELHQGAVFVATSEMWVAARTDPELAAHVGEIEAMVDAGVAEAAEPGGSSPLVGTDVRDAVFSAMDAIRGLVMSSWHLPEAEVLARWHRLKRHLAMVFPPATA